MSQSTPARSTRHAGSASSPAAMASTALATPRVAPSTPTTPRRSRLDRRRPRPRSRAVTPTTRSHHATASFSLSASSSSSSATSASRRPRRPPRRARDARAPGAAASSDPPPSAGGGGGGVLARTSSSSTSSSLTADERRLLVHPAPPSRTVIVGGGPTGLASAIMLARRGWTNVEVWERLPPPPGSDAKAWGDPERSYNVGVSGRGQIALERLGCLDRVLAQCKEVKGRMDWTPGNATPTTRVSDKKYATQVIQRDRLVSCLLEEIREKYSAAVRVHHGVSCVDVKWRPGGGADLTRAATSDANANAFSVADADADACDPTSLEGCDVDDAATSRAASEARSYDEEMRMPPTTVNAQFVIGAEGASPRNAVMRAMDADRACGTKMVRFEDTNPRVYKTVPVRRLVAPFRKIFSARSFSFSSRPPFSAPLAFESQSLAVSDAAVRPSVIPSFLPSLATTRARSPSPRTGART